MTTVLVSFFFSFCRISVEGAITAIMLALEPPNAITNYSKPGRAIRVCDTTPQGILAPLGFDLLLIFMCTVYAIKTRNFPENFNEAKFIGFTMYATCVTYLLILILISFYFLRFT